MVLNLVGNAMKRDAIESDTPYMTSLVPGVGKTRAVLAIFHKHFKRIEE